MEARVGIEPTIGLFCRQPPYHLATAPWRERSDLNAHRWVWRPADCQLSYTPAIAFQLSKSNKKGPLLGRAFLESELFMDSTRRLRALDSSP
jgi:hypothetical protein